jgi:hypothetical protein
MERCRGAGDGETIATSSRQSAGMSAPHQQHYRKAGRIASVVSSLYIQAGLAELSSTKLIAVVHTRKALLGSVNQVCVTARAPDCDELQHRGSSRLKPGLAGTSHAICLPWRVMVTVTEPGFSHSRC